MIEAHCIAPNLWQGSFPIPGDTLRKARFDVLVLCAEEFQPPPGLFPGVKVIHAPNSDSERPPTNQEMKIAIQASRAVAAHVASGHKVLVTCMAGCNRSGLVTAMALMRLYKISGAEAVRKVRSKRRHMTGGALTNEHFVSFLTRIK